jgi:hypothetical protein
MKKLLTLAVIGVVLIGSSTAIAALGGTEKVGIWHYGDQGWELIYVAPAAVPAHLAHGDYVDTPC